MKKKKKRKKRRKKCDNGGRCCDLPCCVKMMKERRREGNDAACCCCCQNEKEEKGREGRKGQFDFRLAPSGEARRPETEMPGVSRGADGTIDEHINGAPLASAHWYSSPSMVNTKKRERERGNAAGDKELFAS